MQIPNIGEMSRWCSFCLVISTFPKFTTFSRVKKEIVEKTVKTRPIAKTTIAIFFIFILVYCLGVEWHRMLYCFFQEDFPVKGKKEKMRFVKPEFLSFLLQSSHLLDGIIQL